MKRTIKIKKKTINFCLVQISIHADDVGETLLQKVPLIHTVSTLVPGKLQTVLIKSCCPDGMFASLKAHFIPTCFVVQKVKSAF